MTTNETIDGIQEIINRNQKTILPRVHIGYLIHAVKYLKEQKEEIENLKQTAQSMMEGICLLKEQEVKTGHWIDTTNTIGFPRCECSECNSEAGAIWMKYCPNCGAKMEGR
jgi:hypothetical protein